MSEPAPPPFPTDKETRLAIAKWLAKKRDEATHPEAKRAFHEAFIAVLDDVI